MATATAARSGTAPSRTARARSRSATTPGPATTSFKSRFEDGEGTNPEELLAAAHAGCFTMALSLILGNDDHEPEQLNTKARAELRNVDGQPTITKIDLEVEGKVHGIDQDAFKEAAEKAKAGCVISRALAGVDEITLEAKLID